MLPRLARLVEPENIIYVDRIDDTLRHVVAEGGEVVRAPYPEGNLWVATFHDPAGNVLGHWQEERR